MERIGSKFKALMEDGKDEPPPSPGPPETGHLPAIKLAAIADREAPGIFGSGRFSLVSFPPPPAPPPPPPPVVPPDSPAAAVLPSPDVPPPPPPLLVVAGAGRFTSDAGVAASPDADFALGVGSVDSAVGLAAVSVDLGLNFLLIKPFLDFCCVVLPVPAFAPAPEPGLAPAAAPVLEPPPALVAAPALPPAPAPVKLPCVLLGGAEFGGGPCCMPWWCMSPCGMPPDGIPPCGAPANDCCCHCMCGMACMTEFCCCWPPEPSCDGDCCWGCDCWDCWWCCI